MAAKTPTSEKPETIEDALRGPQQPEGFSGIRPFVMVYKPAIAVILLGGGLWYFTHPLTLHGAAQAGTMPGKVSGVAAGDIVAQPHAGATLKPLARATLRPASQVARTDLTGTGVTAAATLAPGSAVQQTAPEPAQAPQTASVPQYGAAAPAAPATESPIRLAAERREAADRSAVEAPLPAPAPIATNGDRAKDASAYNAAPPSGTFLEPGHIAPITLYTSVDSTVNGGPALLIGYFGRDVLDYYQRSVLIPRYSRALGHLAGSSLQPGEDRMGAIWSSILLPNGHMIALNDAPGVDLTGTVGFSGKLDNHERGQLARVVAFSILAAGAQLAQPQNATNCGGNFGCSPSVGQSIAQGLGTQIQTLATTQYNRGAQTPPSLHVIEGAQVGLEITSYLPIAPYGSQ